MLTPIITSLAQNSTGSLSKPSQPTQIVTLPTGEQVTVTKVQELLDRAASLASKYRAVTEENKLYEEKARIDEEQIANLKQQIEVYKELMILKDQAIAEYKAAIAVKNESIELRDQRLAEADLRIKALEKRQSSLWQKIKLTARGIGVGVVIAALIGL